MANLYPHPTNYLPQYNSERKLFNAVKTLNNNWTAFFEVTRGTGKREADCLLVHQKYGIFSIECKGGKNFRIRSGKWYRLDGGSTYIGDPISQADNNRGEALRIMRSLGKFPNTYNIVCLPDVNEFGEKVESKYAFSKENIIIKNDLDTLQEKLLNIVDSDKTNPPSSGQTIDEHSLNHLKDQLVPSLYLPSLAQVKSDKEKAVIKFDKKQIHRWRDCLAQRTPSLVIGASGTGKTVLARALANYKSQKNARTLLICRNRLLSGENKLLFKDNQLVECFSYFELMFDVIEASSLKDLGENKTLLKFKDATKMGVDLHTSLDDSDYRYLEENSENLLKHYFSTFDSIIVDEGQQFTKDQLNALRKLLTENNQHSFNIFADPLQSPHEKWTPPKWCFKFPDLNINYRNTQPIVTYMSKVLNAQLPECKFEGLEPKFIYLKNEEKFKELVVQEWNNFTTKSELNPGDITILSPSRSLLNEIYEKLEDNYEKNNIDKTSTILSGQFRTVDEFTGMESQGVILLWPKSKIGKFEIKQQKRRAYQGIGRATDKISIISSQKESELWKSEL
jgi:DNA polymerase III delta prime subunit